MSRANVPAVERIIANKINETARGDPDDLAARIVAALGKAGYHIRLIHISSRQSIRTAMSLAVLGCPM